jgi:hypothetical protein
MEQHACIFLQQEHEPFHHSFSARPILESKATTRDEFGSIIEGTAQPRVLHYYYYLEAGSGAYYWSDPFSQ